MADRSEVIKQSDLLNRLVLDGNTMEELGRVEVLWMYPQVNRVLGFICKSGFLGTRKTAYKLPQIKALGENSILAVGEADKTDATRVQKLESLIHYEVWTDTGNRVGVITDCLFRLRTGVITRYLLVSDRWAGIADGVYLLSPKHIKSFGGKRVLVSEDASKSLKVYSEGIKQKLDSMREFLEAEYQQITQGLRSLLQRAQTTTHQAQEQLEHLTDQTKAQAHSVSEEARQKAWSLRDQVKERGQFWVEQAREKSQHWAEELKERTETLGESWGDRFWDDETQTLNIDAEEIPDSIFDDDEDASYTPASSPTHAFHASQDQLQDESDWDDDDTDWENDTSDTSDPADYWDEWDDWDDEITPGDPHVSSQGAEPERPVREHLLDSTLDSDLASANQNSADQRGVDGTSEDSVPRSLELIDGTPKPKADAASDSEPNLSDETPTQSQAPRQSADSTVWDEDEFTSFNAHPSTSGSGSHEAATSTSQKTIDASMLNDEDDDPWI
ncbi:MAG: hypothetical protein ACFE0I_01970 [Elainellaceae cyanobacterium]